MSLTSYEILFPQISLIQQLEDYIEKHEGGLITAIRNDTDNTMDNRMTVTKK